MFLNLYIFVKWFYCISRELFSHMFKIPELNPAFLYYDYQMLSHHNIQQNNIFYYLSSFVDFSDKNSDWFTFNDSKIPSDIMFLLNKKILIVYFRLINCYHTITVLRLVKCISYCKRFFNCQLWACNCDNLNWWNWFPILLTFKLNLSCFCLRVSEYQWTIFSTLISDPLF